MTNLQNKFEELYKLIPDGDTKMEGVLDALSEYLHEFEPTTPETFLGFIIDEYSRELPRHRLSRLFHLLWLGIEKGFGAKPFQECTDEEKFYSILDIIETEMNEELKRQER